MTPNIHLQAGSRPEALHKGMRLSAGLSGPQWREYLSLHLHGGRLIFLVCSASSSALNLSYSRDLQIFFPAR